MGCSVVDAKKPTQEASKELPPVTSDDYVRGPASASVTLLAYCDFQSAQCEIFNRVLDQLRKYHPDDLRVVMRPFPIPTSVISTLDKSQLSAQAAVAAGYQGKFWEMRDLLDTQYNVWSKLSTEAFKIWVTGQAEGLGLDATRFEKDLTSTDTSSRIQSMYGDARRLGIAAIPTVFINGTLQQRPALSYDGLNSTIGLLALATRQFTTCPPFSIDPARQYTATLHTAKGDLVIQLYADKAPLAVNSFVFLAKQGWFNGVTFHRVIPGFVAQAGDPSGTGAGGPGYYFKNEVSANLSFDKPGVVGMANAGPDTNGSQFFITYTPQPQLDGTYTIFGQVIKGMDVVEALTQRDAQLTAGLPPGDKILSVTVEEK
jgi:cyclophilin family peptidyl-prolyl cis-trans isomerase/protein-disulfide isomerase